MHNGCVNFAQNFENKSLKINCLRAKNCWLFALVPHIIDRMLTHSAMRRAAAHIALARLTHVRDRELLLRFFVLGQTADHVCESMGMGVVQFMLFKSRAKLRFIQQLRTIEVSA